MKNKKLKLKYLIPVIIGIFIIIYASLGMTYFHKNSQQKDISSQIEQKRTTLKKKSPDIDALNAQLNQAKAELEKIQVSLPDSGNGIDIYAELVAMGNTCDVDIQSIQGSNATGSKTSGVSQIMPFSLNVMGTRDNVFNFISNLIQDQTLLRGLGLENISFSGNSGTRITVAMRINIHTWPDLTASD